jgi:hypothetical protein
MDAHLAVTEDEENNTSESQHENGNEDINEIKSQSTCAESQDDCQESQTSTKSDESMEATFNDVLWRSSYVLRYAMNAGKQGALSTSTYNTLIKALAIMQRGSKSQTEITQIGYDVFAAAREAMDYESATGIEINMDS